MYPEQPYQQQQSTQQPGQPAPFDINTNPYTVNKSSSSNDKTKKIAIIAIAGVLLLLFVPIIILAASGSKDKATDESAAQIVSESQAPSLEPANTITLNQVTASISQDLSTLNDAEDFNTAKIEDKTLSL